MPNFRGPVARVALVAMALLAACCDRGPLVAAPSIAANRERVPMRGAVDVTLQFHVSSGPPLPADGRVLLRVLYDDGELMKSYDHEPPRAMNTWTPGATIQYTLRIELPDLPYIGDAYLAVGLASASTNRRMRLDAPKETDVGDRLYKLAKIVITNR